MAQATSELSGLREHSQNVKFNSRCESPSSNQVSTTPRTLLRSNVLQDGIEHIIYYLQRNIWEDAWKSYIVVATSEPGRKTLAITLQARCCRWRVNSTSAMPQPDP